MSHIIMEARSVLKERGVSGLAIAVRDKFLTDSAVFVVGTQRKKIGVYNGVPVRNVPIFSRNDEHAEHEAELISSIRDYLPQDVDVLLIGAGSGASTVVGARKTGPNGSVTAFEAAREKVDECRETIRLNKVEDFAECRHAIVGTLKYALGDPDGASVISARELPKVDALVMDCEGAELDILKSLEDYPETIIVETHAHFDSSTSEVRKTIPTGFEEVSCRNRSENIDILTFKSGQG